MKTFKIILLLLTVFFFNQCEEKTQLKVLGPDYKYWVVGSVDFDGTKYQYDIKVNLNYNTDDARISDDTPNNEVLDDPLLFQNCNLEDTIWLVTVSEADFIGVFINNAYHENRIFNNDEWHDSEFSAGDYSFWTIPNTVDFISTDYLSFTWELDDTDFNCSNFRLPIVVSNFRIEKIENTYHFYVDVASEIDTESIYILGSNDGENWTKVVETTATNAGTYHLIYNRLQ